MQVCYSPLCSEIFSSKTVFVNFLAHIAEYKYNQYKLIAKYSSVLFMNFSTTLSST